MKINVHFRYRRKRVFSCSYFRCTVYSEHVIIVAYCLEFGGLIFRFEALRNKNKISRYTLNGIQIIILFQQVNVSRNKQYNESTDAADTSVQETITA